MLFSLAEMLNIQFISLMSIPYKILTVYFFCIIIIILFFLTALRFYERVFFVLFITVLTYWELSESFPVFSPSFRTFLIVALVSVCFIFLVRRNRVSAKVVDFTQRFERAKQKLATLETMFDFNHVELLLTQLFEDDNCPINDLSMHDQLICFDDMICFKDPPRRIINTFKSLTSVIPDYSLSLCDFLSVEAFAVPSLDDQEHILISPAVLFLPDDAIYFVLAHELGHLYFEHTDQSFWGNLLDFVSIASFSSSVLGLPVLSLSVFALSRTIRTGYSKSQEYEADEFACECLARLALGTKGTEKLMMYFDSIEDKSFFASIKNVFAGTHPAPLKRLQKINDNYSEFLWEEAQTLK